MGRTNFSRQAALNFLDDWGYVYTVPHGYLGDLGEQFGFDQEAVIYLDPYAHQGDGKTVMKIREAVKLYPDSYASLFYPRNYSIRQLQIGRQDIFLKYSSDHPWKSNVGNVQIEKVSAAPRMGSYNEYFPMFAIDYIPFTEFELLAVDLNTAPLIKFTPVEDIMSPKEIVNEIRGWMEWKYGN